MTELETATAQLTEVRTAISAVLTGGQAYALDSRSSQKADLGELRRMESALVTRIARLIRGGRRVQQIVPL
ncbi:MAG TPA: hypothetical protein VIN69_09865 [Candidatus Limnocylindria bacterium]